MELNIEAPAPALKAPRAPWRPWDGTTKAWARA
jgi:hypothetical protein